jgi:hypothetical protein
MLCSSFFFLIFRLQHLLWYSTLYKFWSLFFFARLIVKLFSSTPLSNLCPYLTVSDQVSHPCKAAGNLCVSGDDYGTNSSKHSLDLSVLFSSVYRQNANKWKLCSSRFEVRFTNKYKKCLLTSVQKWSFCYVSDNMKVKIT